MAIADQYKDDRFINTRLEQSDGSEPGFAPGGRARDDEPVVVFYQLSTKFVDTDKDVPEEAQQVMYYTLAMGHHTGVIDCFSEKLSCPLSVYRRILELFPEGGDARYKLEGIIRSNEIQVDQTSLSVLVPAVEELLSQMGDGTDGSEDGDAEMREWLRGFRDALATLEKEPAAYMMGRVRTA